MFPYWAPPTHPGKFRCFLAHVQLFRGHETTLLCCTVPCPISNCGFRAPGVIPRFHAPVSCPVPSRVSNFSSVLFCVLFEPSCGDGHGMWQRKGGNAWQHVHAYEQSTTGQIVENVGAPSASECSSAKPYSRFRAVGRVSTAMGHMCKTVVLLITALRKFSPKRLLIYCGDCGGPPSTYMLAGAACTQCCLIASVRRMALIPVALWLLTMRSMRRLRPFAFKVH